MGKQPKKLITPKKVTKDQTKSTKVRKNTANKTQPTEEQSDTDVSSNDPK